MVRQRVHRHDLFRPPIIESSRREYIKLSPLDSLVSYLPTCLPLRGVPSCVVVFRIVAAIAGAGTGAVMVLLLVALIS